MDTFRHLKFIRNNELINLSQFCFNETNALRFTGRQEFKFIREEKFLPMLFGRKTQWIILSVQHHANDVYSFLMRLYYEARRMSFKLRRPRMLVLLINIFSMEFSFKPNFYFCMHVFSGSH